MKTLYLGQRLREARKGKGQTIEQASSGIGISHNYLGDLERGYKQPSLDLLVDIVNYYLLPADFFIQDNLINATSVVENGLSQKLSELTPGQRKVALDVLDATVHSLKNMTNQ